MRIWSVSDTTFIQPCRGQRLLLTALLSASVLTTQGAAASLESISQRAPAGFADFFTQRSGAITIDLYGETKSVQGEFTAISASVASQDREALEQFLINHGIKPPIATAMADTLVSGIESSSLCQGLVSQCTISPQEYDFVFDQANRRLRAFVNDKNINIQARVRYFDQPRARTLSLINTANLYTQVSRDSSSTRWQNETTVALPLGHFKADTAWVHNEAENQLDVHEANYTIDMRGFSAELGYDDSLGMDNSAFSLSRGQVAGGYHGTLFSNQRLAVRDQNKFDDMSLFVQERTELEIMRGNQLIYRTMLNQGVNRISYSTFPRGSYNVELIYKVGGDVVKTELRNIFNIPLFQMSKGEYDWFARVGRYVNDNDNDDDVVFGSRGYGDHSFAKGAVSGRLFDSAIVGAGYENVGGLSLFSGYLEAIPMERVRAGLVVNSDLNDNVYYNAQLGLGPVSLTGEWLDADDDEFRSIYQSNDFRQLNLSLPFNLFGGSYTANAQHYEVLADESRNDPGIDISSLFVTGNHQVGVVSLSGTLQYDFASDDQDSGWLAAIHVSMPLDDDVRLSSSVQQDDLGNAQLQNTLAYDRELSEQTRLSGDVTLLSSAQRQQLGGHLSVDHTNPWASGDAQMYADTGGQLSGSMNISSTQLIDRETFLFTSQRSPSYLVMENASVMGLNEGSTIGHMEIRNRSQGGTSVVTMNQPTHVLPVSEYSQYDVQLQTGNAQYTSLDSNERSYFARPGTFTRVRNNLVRIKRYLVSFSNETGQFAPDITCSGTGCNDVQEVADNVYQVSLFDGYRFVLRSGDDICLLPNTVGGEQVVNLGRSICASEQTLEWLVQDMPADNRLYYLGATETVNPDLTDNTIQLKVGDLYGQFLFSREEKQLESAGVIYKVPVEYYSQRPQLLESAGITPREIPFPISDIENTVAQE